MDEKQKQKIEKRIFWGSLALLLCAALFIVYTAVVLKKVGTEYYVVIIAFLAAHWFLTDVLSIVLTKGFEGKTERQVKAYKYYAILNLVGLGGLAYFVISIGNNGGMIGACIYAASVMGKRKYKDEYLGIVKEEEEAEENAQMEEASAGEAEEGTDASGGEPEEDD